jgi:hypothetical protein
MDQLAVIRGVLNPPPPRKSPLLIATVCEVSGISRATVSRIINDPTMDPGYLTVRRVYKALVDLAPEYVEAAEKALADAARPETVEADTAKEAV